MKFTALGAPHHRRPRPPCRAARRRGTAAKVYRLGLLYGSSPAFNPESDPYDKAFAQGLRENGYIVGQHVTIEFRSALGKPEQLPGCRTSPTLRRDRVENHR